MNTKQLMIDARKKHRTARMILNLSRLLDEGQSEEDLAELMRLQSTAIDRFAKLESSSDKWTG
jgi:hypothetical protein